jgi:hypothetical protein
MSLDTPIDMALLPADTLLFQRMFMAADLNQDGIVTSDEWTIL